MATIHKVVAYITFERRLLVFEHVGIPEAGVQVVQGTVEEGERLEDAVMREAREETGLAGLGFSNHLKTERTGLGRGEIPLDPPFAKGGDTEETPI